MSQEINMNEDNGDEPCVFATCEVVLHWAHTIAYDIGFVAVIIMSIISTGKREKTSFVLIGCERSGKYREYKKDLVRTVTDTRKCECLFKLRAKPMLGGERWMDSFMHRLCHSLDIHIKSFIGHPYVGRLTKDEKIIICDMTKSMVKPKNIILTLKEHNANNCTTMKQVYNARYAYRSSIRDNYSEMQQLID
ncbi:hypothetical protein GmHk_10G028905 [Glycine max]|nr:hypothetical protein GmHk_10G028905 [Glycine max]